MNFVFLVVVTIIYVGTSGATRDMSNKESLTTTNPNPRGNISSTSSSCPTNRSLSLCIYVIVGFATGITFVLVAGGLVICCIKIRQRQLTGPKNIRLRTRKGRFQCRLDNPRNDGRGIEEQISSGLPGESWSPMTQTSWHDSETESANRQTRCQKCGAAVSTSTLDNRSEKQISSSSRTQPVDFTWKGLIDGTEEVINTELRTPPGEETQFPIFFDSNPLFSENLEDKALQSASQVYKVCTTAEIENGNHETLKNVPDII